MIEQRFALWCDKSTVAQRCAAVARIADILFSRTSDPRETRNAALALGVLGSDVSPKVRVALAERLAREPVAPRSLIRTLSEDVDAVALVVVANSPVLAADDLIDLVAVASPIVRLAIARRAHVCARLAAAIAEVGGSGACRELLANAGAAIPPSALRRIGQLHGAECSIRDCLLRRRDLPGDLRQTLLLEVGHSLETMPLVRHLLGAETASRIASEACQSGTVTIAQALSPSDLPAFSRHLKVSGQISTAFLVRAACGGDLDLFASALAVLSGRPYGRVRSIIVDAGHGPFAALLLASGVPAPAGPLLLCAVRQWKRAVAQGLDPAEEDVAMIVLDRIVSEFRSRPRAEGSDGLGLILSRLLAQVARRTATRGRTLALAA